MSGILERIEAKVDQILAALSILPIDPVDPIDPPPVEPTEPPPAGAGYYYISGAGTVQPVPLPAVIQCRNLIPGSTLNWEKMPIVVKGKVRMTENGVPVDGDGYGPAYNLPVGDHDFLLTPELPGVIVTVQVRA